MTNAIALLVIAGSVGLLYFLASVTDKRFIRDALKLLNTKKEYKTDRNKLFVVGFFSHNPKGISVYKDAIIVSNYYRGGSLRSNIYEKADIKAINIHSGLLQVIPHQSVPKFNRLLSDVAGETSMGTATLRHPDSGFFFFRDRTTVLDELKQDLRAAGYEVTDSRQKIGKIGKVLFVIMLIFLAVIAAYGIAIINTIKKG